MEKIDPQKIEKAVKLYVKQMGLEEGFKHYRIRKAFKQLIGEKLAAHVTKQTISGRKLFVYMDSAIARNEVFMMRSNIAQKINNSYGEFIIEEIIIN